MRSRVLVPVFCAAVLFFLLTGIRAARDPVNTPNPKPGTPNPIPPPAVGNNAALPGGGFLRRDWTLPPQTGARAILVADLESGEEILRVRADAEWPIASLTKLMTAAIVLERFDLNEEIILAEDDFALGRNGMGGALAPGETYLARDLLTLLLVPSSNEAAEAFARVYGRENFIAVMNEQATKWGLARTSFADPSGVSPENRSTAEDLFLLVQNLYARYPDIFLLTRSPQAAAPETSGTMKTVTSTHAFAGRPDFLGGKTGTTPLAGENLISIFSYGRPAVIIVLGDENRFGNTARLFQWFTNDFRSGD